MFDKPTKNAEEEEGMRDQSLSGAYHTRLFAHSPSRNCCPFFAMKFTALLMELPESIIFSSSRPSSVPSLSFLFLSSAS